jgi:hypothetical protein
MTRRRKRRIRKRAEGSRGTQTRKKKWDERSEKDAGRTRQKDGKSGGRIGGGKSPRSEAATAVAREA